jgi:hypothetical protein
MKTTRRRRRRRKSRRKQERAYKPTTHKEGLVLAISSQHPARPEKTNKPCKPIEVKGDRVITDDNSGLGVTLRSTAIGQKCGAS